MKRLLTILMLVLVSIASFGQITAPNGLKVKNSVGALVTITGPELVTLSGVTNSIQSQINSKQATLISGTTLKTINNTSLLGSGNISTGTVTSVNMSVPTGFSITGGPITGSGSFALTFSTGYSLPSTASQALWDNAYAVSVTNPITLTTTSTELNYVHGVTSAIQDQLNAKAGKTVSRNDQTASYTLVLTDAGKYITMNVATANNLTIPLNSSVAFPTNSVITVKCIGAGKTTIVLTSGVTGVSAGDKLGITVHGCVTLVKLDTDKWAIDGNIE